jgi:histone arginine demethylase JMJD6
MIECIQKPGETVFVPGGWWHAVLNLDDTMAVTQNFCNSSNFDNVWRCMRIQRYRLSKYFLHKLKKKCPAFYRRALQLNSADKFILVEERLAGNFMLDISTDSISDSSSEDSSSSSEKSLTDSDSEELQKKPHQNNKPISTAETSN